MFSDQGEKAAMLDLLENWKEDPSGTKGVFVTLKNALLEKENCTLNFVSRPGISYSLRGAVAGDQEKQRPLFVMIDVVDDDPKSRWLSVCFYGDMITDPEEEGDLIPGGLLGEDGYCFDVYEDDASMVPYIVQRIDEAHKAMTGL